MQPSTFTAALLASLAIIALVLGGCAAAPQSAEYHPVFPSPPAEPRIAHRANYRGSADVVKVGLLDALAGLVAGRNVSTIGRPIAVAHALDRLYVGDLDRQVVHVMDLRRGRISTIARAGEVYLVSPAGLAVMGQQLAVADSALAKVFLFDARGRLVRSIEGLNRPTGLYHDPASRQLYVVDTTAHQVLVYDRDLSHVRTIGEHGVGPGQLNFPTQVFVDRQGRTYVTDSMNFRVQVFDPRGRYLAHIGQQGDATGYLAVPKGVAVDSHGHIYVADSYHSNIQVYDQQGQFLLAFGGAGEANGQFHLPVGITIDDKDRLYVADSFNRRIQVFQYIGGTSHETP